MCVWFSCVLLHLQEKRKKEKISLSQDIKSLGHDKGAAQVMRTEPVEPAESVLLFECIKIKAW